MRTTHLTSRELTTVLYALIHYQTVCIVDRLSNKAHFAEHAPLNSDEIDDLCKRLSKPEDRDIMEIFLGRKLDKHEAVQHVNGDPTDNEPSNLRIVKLAKNRGTHV